MLITTLKIIFERDINKLAAEIGLYQNEAAIWCIEKSIANSAGNLTLHLVGNLNNYVGLILGGIAYTRDRDFEFSAKDIPKEELLRMIHNTLQVVTSTLDNLSADVLKEEYPIMVFEKNMTTEFFLIHLATHLNYHLGQINYHRRLLDNVPPVSGN
jgi:uncharacterized damage-inducible protein DinB